VKVLAFGTLAGGLLTERWLDVAAPDPDDLETWSQMKYKRFIDAAGGWAGFQQVLHTVNDVAEKHGVGVPAVASRYILDLPAVAGVILGNRLGPVDHIGDNFDIFSLELEASDRQRIAEAVDQLRPIPGDCGDEYRKPPFLTATGDLSDHLESIPAVFETESDTDNRSRVFSGTSWEAFAGYCRAVREGERILVSGTTAAHGERLIGGDDPAAQAHFVIDKIQAAIESLGGRLEDVVRTRIFVANIEDWEAVARAHGARFAHSPPVNTLVEARLVGSDYKVEIEAEAVCR
jgi:enamine deaminase RidA (YjgF/YER057c/UK114 family)